jgi:hypothetical protein
MEAVGIAAEAQRLNELEAVVHEELGKVGV